MQTPLLHYNFSEMHILFELITSGEACLHVPNRQEALHMTLLLWLPTANEYILQVAVSALLLVSKTTGTKSWKRGEIFGRFVGDPSSLFALGCSLDSVR